MFSNVGTKNTFQETQCGPQCVYARLWGTQQDAPPCGSAGQAMATISYSIITNYSNRELLIS